MAKLTPTEIQIINRRMAAGTYRLQEEVTEQAEKPKPEPKRQGRPAKQRDEGQNDE